MACLPFLPSLSEFRYEGFLRNSVRVLHVLLSFRKRTRMKAGIAAVIPRSARAWKLPEGPSTSPPEMGKMSAALPRKVVEADLSSAFASDREVGRRAVEATVASFQTLLFHEPVAPSLLLFPSCLFLSFRLSRGGSSCSRSVRFSYNLTMG